MCQDLGRLKLPVTVSTPEEFTENVLDHIAWLARLYSQISFLWIPRVCWPLLVDLTGPGPDTLFRDLAICIYTIYIYIYIYTHPIHTMCILYIYIYMAKSRNSVSGPGPVKSTSYGQHTRGIHRKGTREYSLASQAVLSNGFSVNSSGVLTVTGRFNQPRSWHTISRFGHIGKS